MTVLVLVEHGWKRRYISWQERMIGHFVEMVNGEERIYDLYGDRIQEEDIWR